MRRLEKVIDTILNRQQHPYETQQILGKIKSESLRQRRLYESILSNTPDLAYIFDLDFKFIYANNATLQMWGKTWEEAIGKGLPDLGYEAWHVEMHHKELEHVLTAKETVRGEVPFNNTATGRRIYDYIFVPVIGKDGEVEAIAGTTRDITKQKKAEKALERELNNMRRLQEVSTKFIRQGDIQALFDEIMDTALEITGADKGHIQMYDNQEKKLSIKAQQGLPKPFSDRFSSLKTTTTACSVKAFREKERIIVRNIKESSAFDPALLEVILFSKIKTAQSTPLISRSGIVLGIISTYWETDHQLCERQLNLIDLLARQTADLVRQRQSEAALRESQQQLHAINETLEERIAERTAKLQERAAKLRDLAAKLTSAKQQERKRLAAILHDDLQQLLVSAKMHIDFIHPSDNDKVDAGSADKAKEILDQAIHLARDLTTKLRPPALFESGFTHALKWLAEDMQDRHHLNVEIDKKATNYSLSDDIKVLLFESIRELLFNVVKYAGTKKALVRIRKDKGFLRVAVRDEGKGFNVEAVRDKSTESFGLFSVLDRLDALGGSVSIVSQPGQGTTVELKVPVAPRVSANNVKSSDKSGPIDGNSITSNDGIATN